VVIVYTVWSDGHKGYWRQCWQCACCMGAIPGAVRGSRRYTRPFVICGIDRLLGRLQVLCRAAARGHQELARAHKAADVL